MHACSNFISVIMVCAAGLAAAVSAADPPDSENTTTPVVRDEVEVVAEPLDIPAVTILDRPAVRGTLPAGDGSEVLRDVAGADLGRMGGHGLEPFLRGLSQADLTVLVDGATVHGGCPNRMDPATSFTTLETVDRVKVIRGVHTLQHGPGAPGGTILLDRQLPPEDRDWSAEGTTATSRWSASPDLAVDLAAVSGPWAFRALASSRETDSYQDGAGRVVRSAARSANAVLMTGWRPEADTEVRLTYEHIRTDDALFAGAGMDAPKDRAHILRVTGDRLARAGSPGWHVRAFVDSVDHLMNNFALRPLEAPKAMEVPSETTTWGLRGHLVLGPTHPVLVGVVHENAQADATRFAGPDPSRLGTVQSILWPEVVRSQTGVFVEGSTAIAPRSRLVAGVRVDHFTAEARRADEVTMGGSGPSPRQLWRRATGNDDASWSGTGLGALVRLEHALGPWNLAAGLSRTTRAADPTERFLGAMSPSPSMRWVGNPNLDLAVHHQLDLGATWRNPAASVSLSLFAGDASDFILRDRARGQDGVVVADGSTVYRNVDARRYGAEAEAAVRLGRTVTLVAAAAWVRAENTTDGRPIAQTPPVNGRLAIGWSTGRLDAGGTLRWALDQHRVDADPATGSGLDAGPTAGWVVLDLTGGVDLGQGFAVAVGLANALDRTYATHLNRASLFDPEPVRVNEPGRTWWLRLRWRGGA